VLNLIINLITAQHPEDISDHSKRWSEKIFWSSPDLYYLCDNDCFPCLL